MQDRSNLSIQLEKIVRTNLFIFLVYLILLYVFFGLGTDITEIALAPGDGGIFGVPTKIFSTGFNLWNPYIQAGTFSFKDIGWQSSYLPGIVVMKLFPNPFGYNLLLLFHYSLAGFFTFLFLRELKLNNVASRLGGMIFMFCGFLVAHKGHHTMMMASVYLPIVLYFIERYFTTTKVQNLILGAFAFSLSILADYIAVPMYIGMVSFPYIVFRSLSEAAFTPKNLRRMNGKIILILLVIFVGGLLLASVEVIPIIESLPYVTRQSISYDFFASYSFPIKQLPMLIFPYIFGTQSPSPSLYENYYYGQWNLTEMAGYMGILPIMFAPLAVLFFGKGNGKIYFWAAIALFSFILVLGNSTPFYQFMYKIPIYNMFRASARNWLEVNFSVAVLSSYFIHNIITDHGLQKRRYFNTVTWLTITFGAVVVFILVFAKNLVQSVGKKQIWINNTRLDSSAVYIPLIIILISTILLYFLYQFKGNRGYWIVIATVLFFDLFSFGHYHDTEYTTYAIFQNKQNEIAAFLNNTENDKNLYRILSLNMDSIEKQLYPNIDMLYGFNVINGYSPIWLKDYKNLTTFNESGFTSQKFFLLYNSKVLSILSTKYIITSDPTDIEFLQNFRTSTELPESIIVGSAQENQWGFISAENGTDSSVILKSAGLNQVSLMQIPFALHPGIFYTVKFKARILANPSPDNILIVDFFGKNYDLPQQEDHFNKSMLSNEFQEFSISLYSGYSSPASAFLRLFTYSKGAYEIKDVELVQAAVIVPCWKSRQLPQNSCPLYIPEYEASDGTKVYENMNFLPRVRFVKNIMMVKNSDDVINIIWNDDSFDPSTTALVEGLENKNIGLDDGSIIHADFSSNDVIILTVMTGKRGFLVLSDTWYPGWIATIDGKETQIYKTNSVSRGILIEGAGEHLVEFKFVPMSFYIGLLTSGTTILAMMVYLLIAHKIQSKSIQQ